jgi:AcrR family transcriptional regulator
MRSDSDTDGQKDRTFTEAARRAQIVAAAIDTIAESGYAQASLARIASRIGVSKGVIAYHFDGKQDLINEVIAEVAAKGGAYIRSRMTAESSGAGRLRAAIESNLDFMAGHRNHLIALVEIAANARESDSSGPAVGAVARAGVAAVRDLLASFQAQGEFREDFDPQVMAIAIRAAIDAVPPRLARDPGFDVGHYGRELANLFDAATRKAASRTGTRGR